MCLTSPIQNCVVYATLKKFIKRAMSSNAPVSTVRMEENSYSYGATQMAERHRLIGGSVRGY